MMAFFQMYSLLELLVASSGLCKILSDGGALCLTVIVIGNGIDEPSSNTE